jgi:hypothetical protein
VTLIGSADWILGRQRATTKAAAPCTPEKDQLD